MNLFELAAVIKLDSSKYEQGIKTAAKVGVAAVSAAATAIGALTKKSIEAYAEYEQLVGGVETLFGAGGQSIEDYAKAAGKTVSAVKDEYNALMASQQMVFDNAAQAYETAGLSANEYMDTVTSFSASLLQSLGGDTKAAAEYADVAIRDMADNANKMGTSMESIQFAYAGFAKQNYTMLDNLKLGYGGTKSEMQRLLADASKIAGTKFDISNYNDVIQAIHVMQEEMGITGTTAKEAATTIQGSVNAMKGAWANLVTGLADDEADFGKLMSNFVDSAVTAGENIIPRIETTIQGITQLVSAASETIVPLIVDTLMTNLPSLLSAGVDLLLAIINGILDNLDTLIDCVLQLTDTIVDKLIENLPKLVDGGIKLTLGLAEGLIKALPDLLSKTPQIIKGIVSSLVSNLPDIISVGVDIVAGIWKGITGMKAWLWENVKGFFSGIVDGVKNILGIHSPSRVFAGIGENMALGLGVGWEDEFGSVKKGITDGLDFSGDYAGSVTVKSRATATGGQSNTDALLTAILDKLSGMGVYIDGNTLTGYVDSKLGQKTEMNKRLTFA